jgi:hypothetical protein
MLPPQQPHSSPPTVIAVSSNGNVLLSASPKPPTIHVQDRRLKGSAPVRNAFGSDGEERLLFKVVRRKCSRSVGVSDEVRRLRDSNEALRKDMEALRVEFGR